MLRYPRTTTVGENSPVCTLCGRYLEHLSISWSPHSDSRSQTLAHKTNTQERRGHATSTSRMSMSRVAQRAAQAHAAALDNMIRAAANPREAESIAMTFADSVLAMPDAQ